MKAIICALAPESILNAVGRDADQRELGQYITQLVPDDEICALLDQTYGRPYLTDLVIEYAHTHDATQRISIEYGKYDRYRYIQIGSQRFSELLKENGIPYELTVFDGGHAARARIEPSLLPFFVEGFRQD